MYDSKRFNDIFSLSQVKLTRCKNQEQLKPYNQIGGVGGECKTT